MSWQMNKIYITQGGWRAVIVGRHWSCDSPNRVTGTLCVKHLLTPFQYPTITHSEDGRCETHNSNFWLTNVCIDEAQRPDIYKVVARDLGFSCPEEGTKIELQVESNCTCESLLNGHIAGCPDAREEADIFTALKPYVE